MNHNKLSFILDIGMRINQVASLCLLIISIQKGSKLGISLNIFTILLISITILITNRLRESALRDEIKGLYDFHEMFIRRFERIIRND